METLELDVVVVEIRDALDNEVPFDHLMQWINEDLFFNDVQLDTLVGMLEDANLQGFATYLADKIASPTLETDIENSLPWFKNDKRNRGAYDEVFEPRDKKTLVMFKELRPKGSDQLSLPRTKKEWRSDL